MGLNMEANINAEFDIAGLRSFLLGSRLNSWVRVPPFNMYLRRAVHYHNQLAVRTLDIANISNNVNPGNGEFRRFIFMLRHLLETSPELRGQIQAIFVENVFNTRFADFLLGIGAFPQVDPHVIMDGATKVRSFVWPLRLVESLPDAPDLTEQQRHQQVLRQAILRKMEKLAETQARLEHTSAGVKAFTDDLELQANLIDRINGMMRLLR